MKSRVFVLAVLASIQLVHSAALNQDGGKSSQITIAKLGGTSHRVDISESDTVGMLRSKISQLDATSASNLILVFAGKQLDDDSKLLTDYGIQQDSKVIFLQRPAKSAQQPREEPTQSNKHEATSADDGADVQPTTGSTIEFNLFVRDPSGDLFSVPVEAELTVGQLRHVISLLVVAPIEYIQLEFNGVKLHEDSKSLAESGLINESAVNLIIDRHAQSAVLERVIKRIIASLVEQLNNNGKPIANFTVTHNPHFTDLEIVKQTFNEFIIREYRRNPGQTPLILDAYKSENLRAQFSYLFRGERKSILANMNDGAQWVFEQAKEAAAIEANETDQFESEIFGESSTTVGPL